MMDSHIADVRGSSPRMRGALGVSGRSPDRGRIIPADAGSTHHGGTAFGRAEDHPRGCGEHARLCPHRS